MTRNLENIFPFPAIVGQNDLKTVLILNAIYPAIGGVLIRGEKGTAKSTAARGLAMIMPLIDAIKDDPYNRPPDADSSYPDDVAPGAAVIKRPVPFVDLPLGATEDRVLGSLDFERALGEGKRVFQPGLLAAANRGILYIDEVNLLPPHLVDVLLDAAAMGVNTVQREGISITHPAQFTLIGTMNPEEGELRPQLLDRFGLMVDVAAPRDPQLRTEVVRRRIDYEEIPFTYAERWMEQEDVLTGQIAAARVRLHTVTVSDEMLLLISTLCAAFDVDGLRADITLHKTARALAAWEGRTEVTADDIERAVPWVLAHRQRRQPFQQPGIDRDKLQNLLENQSEDTSQQTDDDHPDTETFGANDVHTDLRLQLKTDDQPSQMQHGRRNPSRSGERGRYGRVMSTSRTENLAIDATLRSAAVNGTNDGKPIVHPADYRQRERTGTVGTLILFIVDASGSMAARKRMSAVKGAVLSLLGNAYQHRDHVGVIAFR
ncbi:MAG: ATP-binding protein, partial [Chloroflexota bacterium]